MSAEDILIATYWKNGTAIHLSDGTNHHIINDITVKGDDVYTVGFNYNSALTAGDAMMWKNSLATNLTNNAANSYSTALKVNVSGDDIYISGLSNAKFMVWKNGAP